MRLRTAAPHGAEEHAAGQAEDRAGDEENRREGKERDVAERRPQAKIAYRAFDQRRIETIPIERQPDCRTRDSEPERQAREHGPRRHSTGSRRPSG